MAVCWMPRALVLIFRYFQYYCYTVLSFTFLFLVKPTNLFPSFKCGTYILLLMWCLHLHRESKYSVGAPLPSPLLPLLIQKHSSPLCLYSAMPSKFHNHSLVSCTNFHFPLMTVFHKLNCPFVQDLLHTNIIIFFINESKHRLTL